MNKKKTLSIPLYKGMSIYKRHGTQYWWGYLRINGKQYNKSLETTNKQEAEQLVFQWKNDLLSEANLSSTRSFKFWADKFIELQKEKPIPASGQSAYQYAKKALYRTNGLVEFLGHKNVDEITRLVELNKSDCNPEVDSADKNNRPWVYFNSKRGEYHLAINQCPEEDYLRSIDFDLQNGDGIMATGQDARNQFWEILAQDGIPAEIIGDVPQE
jgi:hypothetical protein